jgi:hypothetical protein
LFEGTWKPDASPPGRSFHAGHEPH